MVVRWTPEKVLLTFLDRPRVVREDVRLAPDDGDAVGLRAERPLEPKVLLVGAPELVQKVPQRRLAVPAKTQDFI